MLKKFVLIVVVLCPLWAQDLASTPTGDTPVGSVLQGANGRLTQDTLEQGFSLSPATSAWHYASAA